MLILVHQSSRPSDSISRLAWIRSRFELSAVWSSWCWVWVGFAWTWFIWRSSLDLSLVFYCFSRKRVIDAEYVDDGAKSNKYVAVRFFSFVWSQIRLVNCIRGWFCYGIRIGFWIWSPLLDKFATRTQNGFVSTGSAMNFAANVRYRFKSSSLVSTEIRALASVITGTNHCLFDGILRNWVTLMP